MRSTTGGQHSFAKVPSANIQRSVFDRSCGHKTTFDAGWLVPIYCDEALPGDTINLQMHTLCRLSTPLVPVMDNMKIDSFFFAVPMRLIWDNWEKFNGAQDNPGDSTSFLIPTAETPPSVGAAIGSLSDYIGIPPLIADLEHSNMWHRAYNLIFNEWFRDQNLTNSVVVDKDDGPDDDTDYTLLRRGKRHDYFTSCLPWPQKGGAVSLPLGTVAPVIPTGPSVSPTFHTDNVSITSTLSRIGTDAIEATDTIASDPLNWSLTGLQADLSGATAATINEIRQAFQIQKLYERDARGGTRYTEIVRSHFGVVSPDARLQRPEFLGGGTQQMNITQVAATGADFGTGTYLGALAGYGTSSGSGHGFAKSFTEHCIIIGMVSARADLNYQQGLERQFSRSTRWDFYLPALAHLGEQAVLNKEIYAQNDANDDLTFGYQERWAEYRYKPSRTSGLMRSQAPTSVDIWHLSQDFSSLPVLGNTFIEEDPPIDRIIAVPTEPQFKMDTFCSIKHARPMPTFSVPGMIDRF